MALIYGSTVGIASGGTVSQIAGYNVHTFDKVGLNTFTSTTNGYVEVLVVGGGAAGSAQTGGSGGGGGGSVLYQRFIPVTAGVSYPVFVGAGGTNGNLGTDSTVNHAEGTITALGGDVGIGSYGLFPITPNSYTRTVGQTVTFNSTSMLANGTTLYYDIDDSSSSSIGYVTSGLVLNLDAANTNSYPGIGITWTDVSGNGKNGTLINGPTYSSVNGGSIVFDGVDDYVNCGAVNFTSGTSITVEVWVKPNSSQNALADILDYDHGAGGFVIQQDGASLNQYYFAYYNGASYDITLPITLNSNSFNHLVFVKSGTSTIGYLNSVNTIQYTGSLNIICTGLSFALGRFIQGAGREFKGNISNTKIYNRALTATEVLQNYNAHRNRYQSSSNFTDGLLIGTTTVSNGAIVPISKTITGTGNTSFNLNLRVNGNGGQIVSTLPIPVVIPQVSVIFSSVPSTINEGASGTFNVTTTNIANETTLYWTINNQTTNSADFGATSGSFIVNSNAGTFSIPVATNLTAEGAETFTVSVRIDGTSGTTVATSSAVTIPAKTYTFTTTPTVINESSGTSGNFVLTTVNVTNGTTLFWTIDNISTVDADFGATSGSFTINSNSGTFSVPIATDATLETSETFRVQVRYLSITGEIVANSASVTISAASVTFSSTPSTINEGASGTFNVTTNSVSNGHVLFWTINDITTNSADFGATSGSFIVNSNAGTFSIPVATNLTVEGAETFTVSVRDGSTSGAILVTSASVTIPAKTYIFTTTPTVINESSGTSGNFTLTTTNVTNGTTLFWTIDNISTVDADFGATSGSFTINSNTGTFSVPIATDATLEGAETFRVQIRYLSITGEIVANSASVTISAATVTFSSTPSTINEGASGTFNVTTNSISNGHVLFWTINNVTTLDDDFGATSGSFIVNSNAGTFSVPVATNLFVEGAQTFTVSVRDGSTSGAILVTSASVTIPAKTYIFSSTPSTINEGASGTFNVTTTNVTNGTTLFWNTDHITTDSTDFTSNSGFFTITSNAGSFSVPVATNLTAEGAQTFRIQLRYQSNVGELVATSGTVTIPAKTYIFSSTPSTINEGASGTFNVTTTNVTNGTTLFWTVEHGTTDAADFGTTSGSFTITSNVGSFSIPVATNLTAEGAQTFTVRIRYLSITGEIVATSSTVTIPAKTYAFTLTPTVINESTGTSGNFTLTTTNVTNGTTLFWTVLNGTTVDSDFTSTSGSFTINSNTGTFSVPIVSDAILEGSETFSVQVRYQSITGEIVATSASVTISAATVTFGSIPSSINEGVSGTFNVTTNSISNGHTLYWTINHITTDSSDFTSTSGSFTITSNAGSFSVPIANDLVTESSETFTVSVRDGSTSGTVYATSGSVTINDRTFVTTASTPAIQEGTSVIFTTNAAYANGTILYYDITGSAGITAADFTINSLTGTYNVLSGTASTTITATPDGSSEGLETFQLNIRTSPSGPYISTSPTVTISDTPIINSRATWTSSATNGQNALLRGTSNTLYSLAVSADPLGIKSIRFPVTWPSSSFVSDGQNQITPFTMGASNFSIMSDVSYIFGTGNFGVSPISGASESCCDPYGMNFGGITIFSARGGLSNTYQRVTGFSGSFTSNSGNVTYSTDGSVNGGVGLVGATGNFFLS
jgi:hypothetical protein